LQQGLIVRIFLELAKDLKRQAAIDFCTWMEAVKVGAELPHSKSRSCHAQVQQCCTPPV
jgi:hypothetical protein